MQKYSINPTKSWEELGEAGEKKVLATVPEGFSRFVNILVPCCHGNDFEEIDLVVVGATGIWAIEIKNWRGVTYLGSSREELIFVRNMPDGQRTSYRDNPFFQARAHAEDLHRYLAKSLKEWFPSIKTLVVFASRDPNGVNGVNLDNVRHANPSIIYLEEMAKALKDSTKTIHAWATPQRLKNALSKLRTWDVILFANGERKRGLICQWLSFDRFELGIGGQTVFVDLGNISLIEVMHKTQGQVSARFVFQSGDTQIGELLDHTIPFQFPDGRIEQVRLSDITEIRTGFLPVQDSQGRNPSP